MKYALAIALTLSCLSAARAQAPEDDSGLRANCVGDYFRYCSSYFPGSTAIRACFKQNFRQLTAGCQGAIVEFDRRAARRS